MTAAKLRIATAVSALGAALCCRTTVVAGAPPPGGGGPPTDHSAETAAEGATRYVVAAVGDSLTDFASNGGLYLRYLKERCPESRFESFGKGGDMVNQMRRRFVRDVYANDSGATPRYTHVIIFGGVNDLYSDVTAKRTVEKISKDLSIMYAAAHERGAKVVAVTVTPWGGFTRYYTEARGRTTEALNRWILAEQRKGSIEFAVDANPLLSCGDPSRLCDRYAAPFKDGLHFGPEGHKRLAEALAGAVFQHCR